MNYIIKSKPEEFIVSEDSINHFVDNGEYLIFRLRKKNCNTEDCVQRISFALHLERKQIGYAGSKDNKAITEQNISIKGRTKEKILSLVLKDIELKFSGCSDKPISLGDLEGNSFEIIVRNISIQPKKIDSFINFFGEQRFGKNNAEIGRLIIKKDFKKAIEAILESSAREEVSIKEHLMKNKSDYVGALKRIPWKTLNLYIHAYQSELWNKVASRVEKAGREIPLIGFGTEYNDKEVEETYLKILEEEGITQNDFVIRQIPDLSSAGTTRAMIAKIKNLEFGVLEDDEINSGMKKIKVKFSLDKGNYATEAIKTMF